MSNRAPKGRNPARKAAQSKIQEFARGIVDLVLTQAEERHKDLQHQGYFQLCETASCRAVRDQAVRLYDVIKGLTAANLPVETKQVLQTSSRVVEKDNLCSAVLVLSSLTSSYNKRQMKELAAVAVGPSPKQLSAWAQRSSQAVVRSKLCSAELDLIG